MIKFYLYQKNNGLYWIIINYNVTFILLIKLIILFIILFSSKSNKISINVINAPLPFTEGEKIVIEKTGSKLGPTLFLLFTGMALSFIPAGLSILIVKERESAAKYQ